MADCPETTRDVLDHYRLCQKLSHVGHQDKWRIVSYLHCIIALNLFLKNLILYRHMHWGFSPSHSASVICCPQMWHLRICSSSGRESAVNIVQWSAWELLAKWLMGMHLWWMWHQALKLLMLTLQWYTIAWTVMVSTLSPSKTASLIFQINRSHNCWACDSTRCWMQHPIYQGPLWLDLCCHFDSM